MRKAVAYVLDRNAMRLTRGGAIDGRDRDALHRPELRRTGFAQAGGFEFNPFPARSHAGNVAMAKSRC